LISLFGLVTNVIVIKVIIDKKNKELFKQFRQNTFLAFNSFFNLLILIVQILSWINECFYPFEIFCPEIRKLVVVQFFKIILKQCLVTAFRKTPESLEYLRKKGKFILKKQTRYIVLKSGINFLTLYNQIFY